MDTISFLDDLNRLENTIKAQNLSNIVLGSNKTIFAPIDSAWNAVNGTNLPFGTIVHFLKYQVIEGVYYQRDLIGKNQTFTTNYLSNPITVQTDAFGRLHIVANIIGQPNIVADIVKSDILTSGGVIHLVDRIILGQASTDANANSKFKLATSPTSSSSSHLKVISLYYLFFIHTVCFIIL
ncbi:hypothetical protein K501DRAFT_287481 [Backusella circina FSU 941]|nr:hypothetical protein K501DRAFT_287481 [Backusella circina FSU 941]